MNWGRYSQFLEMRLNLLFEGDPLGAVFAVVEKGLRTVFKAEIFTIRITDAFPFVVTDDSTNRNVVLFHELCGEASSAVFGGGEGAIAVFAHFDSDGVFITSSFVVGMLALLICGKALVDGMRIDAKVPSEIT